MVAWNRQVFGLKLCGPVPLLCLIFTVPPGKTKVAVGPLLSWSAPGAVKTPYAMSGKVEAVPDVVVIWKCSVPVTAAGPRAATGDAPAGLASPTTAAAAAPAMVATAARLPAVNAVNPVNICNPSLVAARRIGRTARQSKHRPGRRRGASRYAPPDLGRPHIAVGPLAVLTGGA